MDLSERDILYDLMTDTKYISTGYHQAILESATDMVRNTFMQIHDDQLAFHKKLFEILQSRGYYQVEPASGTYFQTGMQSTVMGQPMGGTIGAYMHPYQYGTMGQTPDLKPGTNFGQNPDQSSGR